MKHVKTFNNFNKLNENGSDNPHQHSYMMLGRLESDCEYFLNHGKGSVRSLWADTIEEHIAEMKKLWDGLPDDGKPEWLSYDKIEEYEREMLAYGK